MMTVVSIAHLILQVVLPSSISVNPTIVMTIGRTMTTHNSSSSMSIMLFNSVAICNQGGVTIV